MSDKKFQDWFDFKYGELKHYFDSTHLGLGKDAYLAGYEQGREQMAKETIVFWAEKKKEMEAK